MKVFKLHQLSWISASAHLRTLAATPQKLSVIPSRIQLLSSLISTRSSSALHLKGSNLTRKMEGQVLTHSIVPPPTYVEESSTQLFAESTFRTVSIDFSLARKLVCC